MTRTIRHMACALGALLCMLAITGCNSDDQDPIVIGKGALTVKLRLSGGGTDGMKPSDHETAGLNLSDFVIICWEKSHPDTFYSVDYDPVDETTLTLPVGEFTMEVMYNTYQTTSEGSGLISYGTQDFTILKDQVTKVTYTVTSPQ